MPRVENSRSEAVDEFIDRRMAKPGDNVSNGELGSVIELTASIQVHICAYDKVKAVDISVGISKSYLNKLASTSLEGWEWLDSIDAFLVTFTHAIGVAMIFLEEVDRVGS